MQVEATAASLTSSGVFVLLEAAGVTTWRGSKASDPEAASAERLASRLLAEQQQQQQQSSEEEVEEAVVEEGRREALGITRLIEGEGDGSFCDALGGRWVDDDGGEAKVVPEEVKGSRLFRILGIQGLTAQFQEVFDFRQRDLEPDSAMALDVGQEMYVWVGRDVEKVQRVGALGAVMHRLKKAISFFSAGDPDVPVTQARPRIPLHHHPHTSHAHTHTLSLSHAKTSLWAVAAHH